MRDNIVTPHGWGSHIQHPGLWIRRGDTTARARPPKSARARLNAPASPTEAQRRGTRPIPDATSRASLPGEPAVHPLRSLLGSTRRAGCRARPDVPTCCTPYTGHDFSAAMQAALSPPAPAGGNPAGSCWQEAGFGALWGGAWLPPAVFPQGGSHPLSSSSPTPPLGNTHAPQFLEEQ